MAYDEAIHKPARDTGTPRSESAAENPQPVSSLVEKARVIEVNIRDYTVTVATEHTYKQRLDIPFMVPYCDATQGEGINFMPEVGSLCYICTPSEERGEAFVLGWRMPDENGAYRAGRPLLNPGDQHFATRDGNFLILRRGGVVQIGANDICQMVFIPIRNIMEFFAENFGFHSPAGDLTWEVARKDEDADGHQKTLLTLDAHEFSDDPIKDPIARLKIGSHGDGNSTILTLETRDKGGGSVKTSLTLSKTGDVAWKVQKFTLNALGDVLFKTAGKLDVDAAQDATVKSATKVSVSAPTVAVAAGATKLDMDASGAKISGPGVTLPGGQFPVMRWTPDIATWFAIATAALAAAGPVTGVPALVPPTQHTNTKVKV